MRAMPTLAWAEGDEGPHDEASQAATSDDIVVRDGIFLADHPPAIEQSATEATATELDRAPLQPAGTRR